MIYFFMRSVDTESSKTPAKQTNAKLDMLGMI